MEGIPKLDDYMNSKYDGWVDVPTLNGQVVLDGMDLLYFLTKEKSQGDLETQNNLYKKVNLEWKFGGQYAVLRDSLEHFFDVLTQNRDGPIHVVLDGINPNDEFDEIIRCKKDDILTFIITEINHRASQVENRSINSQAIIRPPLPPLVIETFRKFLEDYNHSQLVKVYSADKESKSMGVAIANYFECPLLGEDSDFYIFPLTHGYIPYSKLTWSEVGSLVTGKAYYCDSFARSLGIEPELVLAIPAIVGNDSISNLVDTTSLKRVRKNNPKSTNNPPKSASDTKKVIKFIKGKKNLYLLRKNINDNDDKSVLSKFMENFQKANEMYDFQVFNEVEFRKVSSYRPETGDDFPSWMIEQYRDFKLSKDVFEVLLNGYIFHRVIPDNHHDQSAKIFSRPIRQEMFGIMEVQEKVSEKVREGTGFFIDPVDPSSSELSIYTMDKVPVETKICKLCDVSMCNSATLSSLDPQWYVAIASVCYWANTACIPWDDVKLKALLLCFAECFMQDTTAFDPTFDVQNLHYLAQWQCTYHDCIMLNQILGLPLPYLSPAYLFDGKRVSHYYQQSNYYLDERIVEATPEIRSIYRKLQKVILLNLPD